MSLHVHLFTLFLLLAAASGLGFFWAKHTEINALLLETRTNAMHQYLVKDENISAADAILNHATPITPTAGNNKTAKDGPT